MKKVAEYIYNAPSCMCMSYTMCVFAHVQKKRLGENVNG